MDTVVEQPTALHVVTDSFSARTAVAPLADYLTACGWRNVIVCSGREYDDAHSFTVQLRSQGFDIRDVDMPRKINVWADLRRVIEVWALVRREKPLLIHTHLAKGGVIGRVAAWLSRTPCVHTVYDYAFVEHTGIRRWFYRAIERAMATVPRRIMFLSENERQISLAEKIGDPRRLVTVGMGADLQLFNPATVSDVAVAEVKRSFEVPDQRLVIGSVARLIPRKGLDLLLRAVSKLPTSTVDWHVLIAGGGPLQNSLLEMTLRLGIADRVSFAGFIDDPKLMPAVFAAMDVFCLPSRREGYGVVYAEAAAMGRVAVAPDMPPVNAIVLDGVTGLLSEPEDPESIAAKLNRLLEDEPLRVLLGERARAFATKSCNVRDAVCRVTALYDESLALIRLARRRSTSDMIRAGERRAESPRRS